MNILNKTVGNYLFLNILIIGFILIILALVFLTIKDKNKWKKYGLISGMVILFVPFATFLYEKNKLSKPKSYFGGSNYVKPIYNPPNNNNIMYGGTQNAFIDVPKPNNNIFGNVDISKHDYLFN